MSLPARPLTHLIGAVTQRDWMTAKDLAAYAKFPSAEAARKYVRRHEGDLLTARRGRTLLVDRLAFDRHVERRALKRIAG